MIEGLRTVEPMINRIRKSFIAADYCPHGGRIREAAAGISGEVDALLDFSANINPLGSPPLVEVILQELSRVGHYPDNSYRDFREAASAFVGVSPENIVPGNGSSEIIRLFAEMTLQDGDLAVIPSPTFGEYEGQARLSGAEIRRVELGLPRPQSLDRVFDDCLLDQAKSVFICNPNNPTGFLISGPQIAKLARRCQEHETFLLVDEAFIELSDPMQSIAGLAPHLDNLVVMRSLTKSFGVPGLRLGFAVTNRKLAAIMDRARIPWSISSLASGAAVHLLGFEDFLAASRACIEEELVWLTGELKELGLEPLESSVNFILINVESSGLLSAELVDRMAEQRVLVRDCQSFGLGQSYIRVAVRNRQENQKLIQALERVLHGTDKL